MSSRPTRRPSRPARSRLSFLPVSHSIPESSALILDTPVGRVVHTGDFKLDGAPVVGEPFDAELWHDIAADGIKALVCDSTNVHVPNPAGPNRRW